MLRRLVEYCADQNASEIVCRNCPEVIHPPMVECAEQQRQRGRANDREQQEDHRALEGQRGEASHEISVCSSGLFQDFSLFHELELAISHHHSAINDDRLNVARFSTVNELAEEIIDRLVVDGIQTNQD